MYTRLHKLARTAPAVRVEMALSADSVAVLACRHAVSEATARKWKSRSSSQDRSHIAHKLPTTLAAVVCALNSLASDQDCLIPKRDWSFKFFTAFGQTPCRVVPVSKLRKCSSIHFFLGSLQKTEFKAR